MTPDLLEQPTLVHGEPSPQDDRVGIAVRTPFDQGFVDDLKSTWRHGERLWDPDAEEWWIVMDAASEIEDLVVHHFGGCRIVDEAGNERYRDGGGNYRQGGLW